MYTTPQQAPGGLHAFAQIPQNAYPPHPQLDQMAHSNYLPTYGPGPQNMSHEEDGRKYSLIVAQSPQRARMCGFGDKDRRPITPPPCVRLIIIDVATGKELDADQIDTSFFILTVDLWSSDGRQENNLIKTMNSAASIGTSEAGSFLSSTAMSGPGPMASPMPPPGQPIMYHHPVYPGGMMPPPSPYAAYPPQYAVAPSPTSPYTPTGAPVYFPQYSMMPPPLPTHPPSQMQQAAVGMFSRNLVGSLASSAFVLDDDTGKRGVWFILSDLSVRSEGMYRLKLNFVHIGAKPGAQGTVENGKSSKKPSQSPHTVLNEGAAPILASTFSEPFQVYSAKKFPGVSDSTALSRKFAAQGIKLPIRKSEMRRSGAGDDDYDSD